MDTIARPCRYCRRFVCADPISDTAVCSRGGAIRYHREPEAGCEHWAREPGRSDDYHAWVNDDLARRLTQARIAAKTRRTG